MLRLRPYKPSDAAKIVAWVSDWDGFSAWCADLLDWPPDRSVPGKAAAWEFEREADRWLMTALDKLGTPTGFLMMTRADYQANSIHLGLIIVDPARRGQGFGQEMVSLALRYAQEILGHGAGHPASLRPQPGRPGLLPPLRLPGDRAGGGILSPTGTRCGTAIPWRPGSDVPHTRKRRSACLAGRRFCAGRYRQRG